LVLGATFVVAQERVIENPINPKILILMENGETSMEGLSGRRDLSQYAQGGHYDFRTNPLGIRRGNQKLSDLAEFLSRNLEEKHLGYVRVTYVGIDAGASYHFFIEPDRSGLWAITTRMVGWHALPNGNRVVDFPKAYRIAKVEDNAKILKLKFFGKSGDEIEQLKIK
jgi:hypothetical protein